jgi:hypothetical protein
MSKPLSVNTEYSNSKKNHKRQITDLPSISGSYTQKNLPIKKLLQMYPSFLHCDRLSMAESMTGPIGPGYYNSNPSTLSGPAFAFSCVTRFSLPFSGHVSPTNKDTIDFTKKNKLMYQFSPENRYEKLKTNAKQEKFKIKQVLSKKKEISKEKKKSKLKKIQEKHMRYLMKAQHTQIKVIGSNWLEVFICITVCNSISNRLNYMKDLHRRSKILLNNLYAFCKAYGKFKIILHTFRIKKAKIRLNSLSIRIRRITITNQKKYLNILSDIIVNAATQNKIFRLMYQWKNTLVFIQRKIKKILNEKKIFMAIKLLQWEKIEKNMYRTKISANSKTQLFVPIHIKENIIKEHLKVRAREYIQNYKIYKDQVNEILTNYKNYEKKKLFYNQAPDPIDLPPKPVPDYNFTKKHFINMIKIATNVKRRSQIKTKSLIKTKS